MSEKQGVTYFHDEISQKKDGNANAFVRNGRSVVFGEWPQTIKQEKVDIIDKKDKRGFYLGSDGSYYAKVVAKPYYEGYVFSNQTVIETGETYYFKVEPLNWTIIKEEGRKLLIHCDNIIFNKAYQSNFEKDEDGDIVTDFNNAPPDTYANNYIYSEIRKWILNDFLKKLKYSSTFDPDRIKILDYNICEDNSLPSFFDKGFLLSKDEVERFGTGYKPHMRSATDYAKACGTYVYGAKSGVKSRASGKGWWWLRTPCASEGQDTVHAIDQNGVTNYTWIWVNGYGIVPALYIEVI